jgi:hypothetical protein
VTQAEGFVGTRGTLRAFVAALPPVLGFIAWVVASGIAARSVPYALPEQPRLAQTIVYAIAIMGGLGGLVGFWYSADSIEFLVRGYRVRLANRTEGMYEERAADGSITGLPFGYTALADAYRPACEVCLPSEERWDVEVPSWARNRRNAIVASIAKFLGADFGTCVRFVDSSGVRSRPEAD